MATKPKRCPGCSQPIAPAAPWCRPCDQRMPTELQRNVIHADRALRAAQTTALTWLTAHPHATRRELDIISLAAQGRGNQEIADQLHLSVHTVKDAWRQLSKRWGCTGRPHIVATAFKLGYMRLEIRS